MKLFDAQQKYDRWKRINNIYKIGVIDNSIKTTVKER